MNERVWTIGRITLIGKNQNTQRKTWHSATLLTTNPIWTGLQVNLGVCGERSSVKGKCEIISQLLWNEDQ